MNMLIKSKPKTTAPQRGMQDTRIYTHVFEAILEQRLLPGTRLNETALGDIFGVSRTIIRRTLTRLAQEGVVELIPNKGATVSSPTPEQAMETLTARQLIEEAVLRLAINAANKKDFDGLRKLIDMEEAAFHSGDRGKALRLSGEFHLRLATIANNQPLQTFLERLVSQTSLIIAIYEQNPAESNCSYVEHRELVTALEQGQLDKATDLMNHHIKHIEHKLMFKEKRQTDLQKVFAGIAK